QHIAAELVGRFEKERAGLAAMALNTNASNITAIANDFQYSQIFSRQVEALGREGDLFIGISTSGNSANIVNAVECAKSMNITTVGLTGNTGGALKGLCDFCICVPSDNTARIQESHITIGHILCGLIENKF
ncbi:MAG: SIS domain-containing protein, partial [Thiohalomonadales bacterium]